jgi:hypothetical protein
MTLEEYDKTGWTGNMKAEYRGQIYDIGAANFPEYLIALDDGTDDYTWVRCENITLVPNVKLTG